jgi:hypothetical protein
MSTSLATLRQLLSADIGDVIFGSCASTTTADGNAGGTTLVDTALCALPSDWIRTGEGGEPQTHIKITSGTHDTQVRPCTTFVNTTGTITFSPAVTAATKVASGTTYEIHRMAHPTLKEDCIAKASKEAYPSLYTLSDTEVFRWGDWLIDGHFEEWSSTSALSHWTKSAVTLAQTSTAGLTHGSTYSCAISTATGYIGQSKSDNPDLLMLGGTNPQFYAWVLASTASQVRLAIYDGTTTTYSDYHTGGGAWELLDVTATIASNPTDVAFRVYYNSLATTAYVDDAGVVNGAQKFNYDISSLSLVNGVPNLIFTVSGQDLNDEAAKPLGRSTPCYCWRPLGENKIQFTRTLPEGSRLRIVGRKYLTEPTSSVSTEADAPQTYIISALAAKRLYAILAGTGASHSIEGYRDLENYWAQEAERRKRQYGMKPLPITRTQG